MAKSILMKLCILGNSGAPRKVFETVEIISIFLNVIGPNPFYNLHADIYFSF